MEEEISKTQKKRDAENLKNLGVELIALSREQLARLPLSPELLQAVLDAKSIKTHGAVRRQTQFIGKLMRKIDATSLIQAYEGLKAEASGKTALFLEIEQWRERLLHEEEADRALALQDLLLVCPKLHVKLLRPLIEKALKDKTTQHNTGASKALFRFLRTALS